MIIDYLKNLDKKITNKQFLAIYLGLVLLWCLAFSFQGLNINEEGWQMSAYQQIFWNPSSVEYQFLYYLSIVIGGVWDLLFGWMGLYSSRILSIIVTCITAYISYLFFHKLIGRWYLLLGMFVLLVHGKDGIRCFEYTTIVFTLWACYLLYLGMIKNKNKYFLFSGFLLGINSFIRLPSVLLVLVLLSLIPYAVYNGKRTALKKLFVSLIGMLSGICAVIILMLLLGHFSIFTESINDILSAGKNSGSTHNVGTMIAGYVNNYELLLKYAILFFAAPVLALLLSMRDRYSKDRKTFFLLLLTVLLVSVSYALMNDNMIIPIFSILTVSLIIAAIIFRRDPTIEYAIIITLIATHVQCVGSDGGFLTSGNCFAISLPLALGLTSKTTKKLFHYPELRTMVYALLAAFFIVYMFRGFKAVVVHNVFYENSPRTTMWYKPDAHLATTLISRSNKQVLDSALVEIRKYVKKDDQLLCLEHLPMINYLTETRPYLSNSWPWSYDPGNLEIHIKRAEKEIKGLPVIIIGKNKAGFYSEYDPDWNNTNADANNIVHNVKRILLYQSFIKRHHYRTAWENYHFIIMVPPGYKPPEHVDGE